MIQGRRWNRYGFSHAGFVIAALVLTLGLAGCMNAPTGIAPEQPVAGNDNFLLTGVFNVQEVALITGPDSINKTDAYAVAGTDLGSMINVGDKTYYVFGDTFGYRAPGFTGGGGEDWRSNVLAVSTDRKPGDGITFERFITDREGHAAELIPSKKVDNVEMTTIPTHGVAVGDTLYLYFMSVRHWGEPGMWDANYSGVSRSTDGGETWEIVEGLRWEGESNFIQVSPFKVANGNGGTEIYFWGIPAGRFGGVQLMKVAEEEIEQLSSYRYFAGVDSAGAPIWSAEIGDAATVIDDTVGELSVIWNEGLGRWIMTYLHGGGDVVIREGLQPWGPWGEAIPLMTQAGFPGLYGPFMNPRFVENDGKTIYFTISRWLPYNVYWMKANLVTRSSN